MVRHKPARRSPRLSKVIEWSPEVEGLFRLAAVGWTPPATVTITGGATAQTWTAAFEDPQGVPFVLKVHLRRRADKWFVAEETLQTRLVGRLGGAR